MSVTIASFPPSMINGFTKSNYKLHCFVCDNTIKRGEEITQHVEFCGIELRPRLIIDNGKNIGGYTPYTNARWIHKKCYRALGMCTEYAAVLESEESNRITTEQTNYIINNLKLDSSLSLYEIIDAGKRFGYAKNTGVKMIGELLDEIVYNMKNEETIAIKELMKLIIIELELDSYLSADDIINISIKRGFTRYKKSESIYEVLNDIMHNIIHSQGQFNYF